MLPTRAWKVTGLCAVDCWIVTKTAERNASSFELCCRIAVPKPYFDRSWSSVQIHFSCSMFFLEKMIRAGPFLLGCSTSPIFINLPQLQLMPRLCTQSSTTGSPANSIAACNGMLYSSHDDDVIREWSLETGEELRSFNHRGSNAVVYGTEKYLFTWATWLFRNDLNRSKTGSKLCVVSLVASLMVSKSFPLLHVETLWQDFRCRFIPSYRPPGIDRWQMCLQGVVFGFRCCGEVL